MSEREAKFVMPDVCPVCGKQKPCVLHDRLYRDELLGEEEEKLPTFEKRDIFECHYNISSIALLSGTSFVVGDKGGVVYIFEKKDSDWQEQDILGGEQGYGQGIIRKVIQLSETSFVIGGEGGQVDLFEKVEMKWRKTGTIGKAGFLIMSMCKLSEDAFIVAGKGRHVEIYRNLKGQWGKAETLEDYMGNTLYSITRLSEDSFAAHEEPHDVSIHKVSIYKIIDGQWRKVESLKNTDGSIECLTLLSDDSFVMGGKLGAVRIYDKVGGKWQAGDLLEIFGEDVRIARLSEDTFVAGRRGGSICLYKKEGGKWKNMQSLEDYSGEIVTSMVQLSERSFVVGGGPALSLYEISEDKLRAYHERQLAKTDEPVPELPEV